MFLKLRSRFVKSKRLKRGVRLYVGRGSDPRPTWHILYIYIYIYIFYFLIKKKKTKIPQNIEYPYALSFPHFQKIFIPKFQKRASTHPPLIPLSPFYNKKIDIY
jgi:hypothetical protein